MPRSWRTPLFAALVVTLLAAPAPWAGADEPDALTLEGPNVVDYEHMLVDGRHVYEPVELLDSVRFVRQGEAVGGRCVFTSDGTRAAGGAVMEVELAFDPDTCRSLVEVGTPTAATLEGASGGQSTSGSAGRLGAAGGGLAGVSGHGATYFARATQQYDEPARWAVDEDIDNGGILPPVNRAHNYVQWTPDGTCAIAPGTTGWMGYHHTWFAFSGWTLDAAAHDMTPDGFCRPSLWSQSSLRFSNNEFCAFIAAAVLPGGLPLWDLIIEDTWTEYQPNRVAGNANDTYSWHMTWDKGGGCESFLRHKLLHESQQV